MNSESGTPPFRHLRLLLHLLILPITLLLLVFLSLCILINKMISNKYEMSINFQMSKKWVSIFWGKISISVWLMMSITDPLKILSAKGGGRYLAGGIKGPGYSLGGFILGCSSRLAYPMFVNGAFVALCAMIILTPGPITILLFVFFWIFYSAQPCDSVCH